MKETRLQDSLKHWAIQQVFLDELWVLKDRLFLAQQQGISSLNVELDAEIVVGIIYNS